MKIWIHNGTVLTPFRKIPNGGLIVEDGKILAVLESGESVSSEGMQIIDAKGHYIAPGLIDVHVHGGGGIELMGSGPAKIAQMCGAHSRYGTTSIVPHAVKANAVQKKLEATEVTNLVPATKLNEHHNWFLYLNEDSACALADTTKQLAE